VSVVEGKMLGRDPDFVAGSKRASGDGAPDAPGAAGGIAFGAATIAFDASLGVNGLALPALGRLLAGRLASVVEGKAKGRDPSIVASTRALGDGGEAGNLSGKIGGDNFAACPVCVLGRTGEGVGVGVGVARAVGSGGADSEGDDSSNRRGGADVTGEFGDSGRGACPVSVLDWGKSVPGDVARPSLSAIRGNGGGLIRVFSSRGILEATGGGADATGGGADAAGEFEDSGRVACPASILDRGNSVPGDVGRPSMSAAGGSGSTLGRGGLIRVFSSRGTTDAIGGASGTPSETEGRLGTVGGDCACC
jgi:hypothetical protein